MCPLFVNTERLDKVLAKEKVAAEVFSPLDCVNNGTDFVGCAVKTLEVDVCATAVTSSLPSVSFEPTGKVAPSAEIVS